MSIAPQNPPPEVTHYLSSSQFLTDYYRYRKSIDAEFSYGLWAQQIGFTNRSFLRQIVKGHRSITENTLTILVNHIEFDDIGKQYFIHLIRKESATDKIEKETYAQELQRLLKLKFESFKIDSPIDFLSAQEIPTLQVLLTYDDIDRSHEALTRMLNCSSTELSRWLEVLESINMAERLEQDGRIQWRATSQRFEVPDKLGDIALKHYHSSSLEKAARAIDLPKAERRFKSLIVPLNESQLADVTQRINEFALSILRTYDGYDFADRKLYQINLNAVPVSGKAIVDSQTSAVAIATQ